MVESFRLKRQQEISSKIIGHLMTHTDQLTDFSEGSIIRSIIEAFSSEIYQNNIVFADSILSAIKTSIKQAFNKPLLSAEKASGMVMFYRKMLPSPIYINNVANESDPGISFAYNTGLLNISPDSKVYYAVSGNKNDQESQATYAFLLPNEGTSVVSSTIKWQKTNGYSAYNIYRSSLNPMTFSTMVSLAQTDKNTISFENVNTANVQRAFNGTPTSLTLSTLTGTGPYYAQLTIAGTGVAWSPSVVARSIISGPPNNLSEDGSLGYGTVTVSDKTSSTVLQLKSSLPFVAGTIPKELFVSAEKSIRGTYFYSLTGIDYLGKESSASFPQEISFYNDFASSSWKQIQNAVSYKLYRSFSSTPNYIYASNSIAQTGLLTTSNYGGSFDSSRTIAYSVSASENGIESPVSQISYIRTPSSNKGTLTNMTAGQETWSAEIIVPMTSNARFYSLYKSISSYSQQEYTGNSSRISKNGTTISASVSSPINFTKDMVGGRININNSLIDSGFKILKFVNNKTLTVEKNTKLKDADFATDSQTFTIQYSPEVLSMPSSSKINLLLPSTQASNTTLFTMALESSTSGILSQTTLEYYISSVIKTTQFVDDTTNIDFEIESEMRSAIGGSNSIAPFTITTTSSLQNVRLTWSATNDPNVTHYRIYRKSTISSVTKYSFEDFTRTTFEFVDTGNASNFTKTLSKSALETTRTLAHLADSDYTAIYNSGTISVSSGNLSTVNGSNTYFMENMIGQTIAISNQIKRIANVISPTQLTVNSAYTSAFSSSSYSITYTPPFSFLRIKDSGTNATSGVSSAWPATNQPMKDSVSCSIPVYSSGSASQSLNSINGVGTSFKTYMIGNQITYFDGTNGGIITSRSQNTALTSATNATVLRQNFRVSPLFSSKIYSSGTITRQSLVDAFGTAGKVITGSDTFWDSSFIGAKFYHNNGTYGGIIKDVLSETSLITDTEALVQNASDNGYAIVKNSLLYLDWQKSTWPYLHRIVFNKNISELTTYGQGTSYGYSDTGIMPELSKDYYASIPTENTAQLSTGILTIPAGTMIRIPNTAKNYEVINNVVMNSSDNSISARVAAVATGKGYNTPKNTITQIITNVYGIDSVTNTADLINGKNNETEEEWVTRFEKTVRSLSRGTKEAIEEGAKIANLTDSSGYIIEEITKSLSVESSQNNILLYVSNGKSYAASAQLIAKCKKIIEGYIDPDTKIIYPGYKAAGIPITIQNAEFQYQNITMNVTLNFGYKLGLVSNTIKTTVQDYFAELDISNGFKIPTATVSPVNVTNISASAIVAGLRYTINDVGTTTWSSFGVTGTASIGTAFTATTNGTSSSGNGTVNLIIDSLTSQTNQYRVVNVDSKGNKSFPSQPKIITTYIPSSYAPTKIAFNKISSGPDLVSTDILKWNGNTWVFIGNKVYGIDSNLWFFLDDGSVDINSAASYSFSNPTLKFFQKPELVQRVMRIPGISSVIINVPDENEDDQEIIIPDVGHLLMLGACEIY